MGVLFYTLLNRKFEKIIIRVKIGGTGKKRIFSDGIYTHVPAPKPAFVTKSYLLRHAGSGFLLFLPIFPKSFETDILYAANRRFLKEMSHLFEFVCLL